jgi:glucodextranase-like protein
MRFNRSPILAVFGVVILAILSSTASFAAKEIFTLTDPRGDDHGDGNLIYPFDDDLDPGDLDLLSLTARDEGNGTWFEATFAKRVRVPGRVAVDNLGTQLDVVARYGFYNLNLDVYIDTDRVPGSGGVTMLPGRHAEIDAATAWEKAVILTPRPNEAKTELQRMLLKILSEDSKRQESDLKSEEIEALKKQIPLDIETRIIFPTQIRVRGQKISFFVPALFLGGPAKATWAYTVATSGADLLVSFGVNYTAGGQEDLKSLMILPISPSGWQDRFGGGRENAPIQPPLVDIIVPKGKKQETILSDFDARAKRPVVIPGVVPAEQ